MIVDNLYVVSISSTPDKTYSPLIVDADAPLTGSFSPKLLQTIRRRNSEVVESHRCIKHAQLSKSGPLNFEWKPSGTPQVEDSLGFRIGPASNHFGIITRDVSNVYRYYSP